MSEAPQVTVTAKIEGICLPTWFAVALAVSAFFSTLILAFVWQENTRMNREIRLLQLHVQDVENVLIRNGSAERRNLAPWGPSQQTRTEPNQE